MTIGDVATEPQTATHLALVEQLLPQLELPWSPELLVFAYREPDPNGHQTVASYVNWRTGGAAHSFALCSPTAPFDALVVVRAYLSEGVRTGLVVIVDLPRTGAPSAAAVPFGPGGWSVREFESGGDDRLGGNDRWGGDGDGSATVRHVRDGDWCAAWRGLEAAGAVADDVVVRWDGTDPCRVLLRPWPAEVSARDSGY